MKIKPDKTSRKAFKITKNVKNGYKSQFIPYEDWQHLQSINVVDRTKEAVSISIR